MQLLFFDVTVVAALSVVGKMSSASCTRHLDRKMPRCDLEVFDGFQGSAVSQIQQARRAPFYQGGLAFSPAPRSAWIKRAPFCQGSLAFSPAPGERGKKTARAVWHSRRRPGERRAPFCQGSLAFPPAPRGAGPRRPFTRRVWLSSPGAGRDFRPRGVNKQRNWASQAPILVDDDDQFAMYQVAC